MTLKERNNFNFIDLLSQHLALANYKIGNRIEKRDLIGYFEFIKIYSKILLIN
jgi:hypothetical protein